MANIKQTIRNPEDGTTTYDKVRFYEADDSSGTNASLLATVAVDTSFIGPTYPGFTSYTYTSGSVSKYYAVKYFNSTSSAETDYSDWVLGGLDRWDTMFMNEMDDTAGAVWTAADRTRFKEWALENLGPELFRQVIDTSLVLDNDSTPTYTYTVPHGIFNIGQVGVGDLQNSTSTFRTIGSDAWEFENNILHFLRIPSSETGATIRLIAHKKFLEVGEVPEKYDSIAMDHMKMSAYLNLSEDYPRFKTYAQLQKGTQVSFENLRVQAREYERKFEAGKLKASEMLYPTFI